MKKMRVLSLLLALALLISCFVGLAAPAKAVTDNQKHMVNRADYLYGITWTAQKDLSGWKNNASNKYIKGNTYRIPYGQPSGSEGHGYITFNVSVDEFLRAAQDSGSKFYTKHNSYEGYNSPYYSLDCSGFVSYCWNLSYKHGTSTLTEVSTKIGKVTTANVQKLQLGDALDYSGHHVVLVTGLTKTNGEITSIEITEQTVPQMKRDTYTVSGLVSAYGSNYSIYRYDGTVADAPNGGDGGGTIDDGNTNSGNGGAYFPKCSSGCTTITQGLNNIGVDSSYSYRKTIAAANNISGYSGTAAQNTDMLNRLKAGTLINPDGKATTPPVSYFPKCSSGCTTITQGLNNIGVDSSYSYRKTIAAANNISGYSGTAAQNTDMLNRLKAGQLIKP